MTDDFLDRKVKIAGRAVLEGNDTVAHKEFIRTVKSKMCAPFDSIAELKLAVLQALGDIARDDTLPGWIKSSDTVDMKTTLEEMTRLQAENSGLRGRVNSLSDRLEELLEEKTSRESLSGDAQELLLAGVEARGGQIEFVRAGGQTTLSAERKQFITDQSSREIARWKAALEELLTQGLIESRGSRGEMFEVTFAGFKRVDEIKQARLPKPTVGP